MVLVYYYVPLAGKLSMRHHGKMGSFHFSSHGDTKCAKMRIYAQHPDPMNKHSCNVLIEIHMYLPTGVSLIISQSVLPLFPTTVFFICSVCVFVTSLYKSIHNRSKSVTSDQHPKLFYSNNIYLLPSQIIQTEEPVENQIKSNWASHS